MAQPGDVNPQNGQPVQSGSTLVDIYCDGVAVSTIVVPPGGAAPPPPPAPAEVAALTPFPAETIHHTPCYMGLTGLRGDMWATVGAGPVLPIATTATIRGYTVHVTAQPVSYQWTTGNGASVVGTNSGSRDNPSASYTYDQTGNYTVTLTVAWSGTYTFSGHGISQTSALGPVNQSPPRQLLWPVQGVVSALVAPGYVDSTTLPTMASAC